MDGQGLSKITDILDRYLNLKGVYSEENSFRYLQIILEGRQEYGFKSSTELRTVEKVISSLNTVDVDTDFIDYVRIGYAMDDQIWTLTKNNDIVLPRGISCGENIAADDTPIETSRRWVDFSATGGHNFLYYRYDKEMRRLVFSGDGVGRTIILEFISDGVTMDGETYVPSDMGSMLIDYLEWQLKKFGAKENKSNNDTEYYRREFSASRKEYTSSKLKFTADEVLDTLRGTYKQTIKR